MNEPLAIGEMRVGYKGDVDINSIAYRLFDTYKSIVELDELVGDGYVDIGGALWKAACEIATYADRELEGYGAGIVTVSVVGCEKQYVIDLPYHLEKGERYCTVTEFVSENWVIGQVWENLLAGFKM